ncbi:UDP-glucuronic acid decarboxylase family protein [Sulfitobacter sp. W074]|uniref:UDP-glucuronic acid decarboxylase family protein n=1 Tax=Sulfitobacter sp. W074 TaxID=2867026 RepID=UPI0021A5BECB|nr:UDP-glucuronic acid decarboxylase family protein [Sulfitobacter sp. W074]UWR39413.1 SDR family oxidoreductase [Sulfitobacter sp. W074]UWR39623.1 SDR family oxidoreductase [Sulfitobacter sp. W074]
MIPQTPQLHVRDSSGRPNPCRRILVAGGAGFLGSHLCHTLLHEEHIVICMDNFTTGRMSNIALMLNDPNFILVRHDIVNPLPDIGLVDEIYNLACVASPKKYQIDPIHTFKTNIWGAMHLLELAVACNAKILQSSTSEIYGDPQITPQPESYRGCVNTMGPRSCYDEGKRAAEALFYDYCKTQDARICVARIFNTYGPSMCPADGRVISNFVVQALSGAPLTIYGDGNQTRSFCYVSDMIAGLMALMAAPDTQTGPYNLGNPEEFTINELAHQIIELLGLSPVVCYVELPQDDPKQRCPDITKAQKDLHWSPRISLAEGLLHTVPYFETELGQVTDLLVAE